MTHTLHRQGTPENLQNDYVVFTMSAKSHNEVGSAAKMQEFLRITRRHRPVNMGDMKTGNWFQVEPEKIETKVQDTSVVHAVFTDIDTVAAVIKELQEADLGLSVVVSGLLGPVRKTCRNLGMTPAPHTVEHSLGVWGKVELLPGKEVVIVGSGDIGLIMARRFTLEGAKVKAVIEIQDKTRGLMRNVVQCVTDFDIPLYFKHKILKIFGRDRVEGVSVAKVDDEMNKIQGTEFTIDCDTVLISVGLIPENELIEMAGLELDRKTNSPVSKEVNKTSMPGLFVCGNAFKVYDLADSVSKDSESAGRLAAEYLKH